MRLITGLFHLWGAFEFLAFVVVFAVVVVGLFVVFCVETVRWSLPGARERMMAEARQRREEEERVERARCGKYGRRRS